MKKIFILICFLSIGLVKAQEEKPIYKKVGGLVQVTFYYIDGTIKEQGFFKNNKLTGTWERYDISGNKITIAHYLEGKKVGKWFFWNKNSLTEVNYGKDHIITSVHVWKEDTKLAVN